MKNPLQIAAIDIGASGGKEFLAKFDGQLLEIEEIYRFKNSPISLASNLFWDFLRLFDEVKKGIQIAVHSSEGKLLSFGLDTWGTDFALLDKTGKLAGNPYCYRDPRTNEIMEKVFKIIPRNEIYKRTGVQFMQFNTLFQLYAMVDENPAALSHAGTFFMIPDLFNYYLTGEKKCEYTNATTTQFYDPTNDKWDEQMLRKLLIPTEMLAEVIQPGNVLGNLSDWICEELSVQPFPIVSVASHDTASAACAVPYIERDTAFLSSGTWSLLGVEEKSPIISPLGLNNNFTCYGGASKTYLVLKNIQALWLLQECLRVWWGNGKKYTHEDIILLANQEKPFISIIDTDAHTFLTPGDFPLKIKEECFRTGQQVPTSDGAIARCILESLALKYRFTFERLQEVVEKDLKKIHVIGGGARNWLLNRFTAEAIKTQVEAGPFEATAIGNILLQLIAMGELDSLESGRRIIRDSFNTDTHEPCLSDKWDEEYDKFLEITSLSQTFNM
jgi:sugar (pentulose or hexulose) kinase